MHQHSNYRHPREEERKKGYEKIFEEIIVENFPSMGKETSNTISLKKNNEKAEKYYTNEGTN